MQFRLQGVWRAGDIQRRYGEFRYCGTSGNVGVKLRHVYFLAKVDPIRIIVIESWYKKHMIGKTILRERPSEIAAWNVPKSTLQRRVKGTVEGHEHAIGRNPVFSKGEEEKLADLIKTLSKKGFPVKKPDIQKLAFEYATANGIQGFSKEKRKAGHYWFEGFMKRNPSLRMRKPEALSAARAACFNPTVVKQWFANFEELLRELEIQDVPSHIWNCDETGLQDHFI
uniref:HTH CENPB-type domain-containing protein n=1 Tax=Paramormyrops kingsleyae TaxID=1676925 RepID=A0A3B3RCA6_9TELE